MQKFGLIFILFFVVNLSFSQYHYEFNKNCNEAYAAIINLKFEAGSKLIEQEKRNNPNNNIPYLLDNYIYLADKEQQEAPCGE